MSGWLSIWTPRYLVAWFFVVMEFWDRKENSKPRPQSKQVNTTRTQSKLTFQEEHRSSSEGDAPSPSSSPSPDSSPPHPLPRPPSLLLCCYTSCYAASTNTTACTTARAGLLASGKMAAILLLIVPVPVPVPVYYSTTTLTT